MNNLIKALKANFFVYALISVFLIPNLSVAEVQCNVLIGDYVWNDSNNDGIQDDNENGISGIEVQLYKDGTKIGIASTDANGKYLFDINSYGNYFVKFILPSGYTFSPKDQGGDDAKDSDADQSTGQTITIPIYSDVNDFTWDAGMYIGTQPQIASVGDFVWYDGDENGRQNTDGSSVGVDNVTVELFHSGGASAGSTTTNSSGWYEFTNLTPGDYYLKFSNIPSGYVFTHKDEGTNNSIDSDVDPANGQTDVFNLSAGDSDMSWDAGIYETENIIPPTDPTCNTNNSLLWQNNIVISGTDVTSDVRFVRGQTTQYTIPQSTYPAAFNGSVDVFISEAIAWDGYANRASTGDQPNERFRVIFKKSGNVVWASPYTGLTGGADGIDTGVISDEWIGILGNPAYLPNGADEIILEHWSVENSWDTNANSVVPSSVCIAYEAGAPNIDYGDAPSTYGDINASITGDYESYIGTIADGENGMQYSTNADGDDNNGSDDEDGVNFVGGNTLLVNTGEQVTLSWSTTLNDGLINGWIDFNGDGDFDSNEQIIDDYLIGHGSGNATGNKTFNYTVPADAICGTSYARFLIADNNISHLPTGSYQYGEVEDYIVNIDGCGGEIIPPTDPTCNTNTSLLWQNNIVINDCDVSTTVRFVRGQTTQYLIPESTYPAAFNGSVDVTISEAVAWDGYCNRPNTGDQPNERFRVVFKKGVDVVWASPYTGVSSSDDGIDTGVISDEWIGPLGGTVNLPDGADKIILEHWSVGNSGDTNANSVVPSSVCIGYETSEPELGSIGNWVWHDTYHYPASGPPNNDHDVDGIQDADELGIESVLVELLQGGSVIDTKTTDASGLYLFTDLPAGDYVVRIAGSNFASGAVLEDWYASPQNRGGNDAFDSDGDGSETQPFQQNVSLSEGENDLTNDFGFFYTCVDLIKTGPEKVKAGETITYHFRYENCGDIVHHTGAHVYDPMINPDGDHEIWNGVVWPGQVVEFDRTYTTTTDDCEKLKNCAWAIGHTVAPYKYSPNLANDRDDDCWEVTVLCCEIEIGDYVWWDENHNGLQDDDALFPSNAPHGLNGVRVILYDGSGTYLEETTTSNGPTGGPGWYEFTDLIPGDYTVTIDDALFLLTYPDLIYPTYDYDGIATAHTTDVTLTDCEKNYNLDFGYDDEPLPVTLSSFTAVSNNGQTDLSWTTESEIENQGFLLERRMFDNGDEWQEIASYLTNTDLLGQGTVTHSTNYVYVDNLVQVGYTYEYRLADIDYNGIIEYHSTRTVAIDEVNLSVNPDEFTLKPAYPNPFNPSTNIEYSIPKDGNVNITIYDLTGQRVSSLLNTEQTAGWHKVRWNGNDNNGVQMPAGVYLVTVNTGNSIKTMKLIFVK